MFFVSAAERAFFSLLFVLFVSFVTVSWFCICTYWNYVIRYGVELPLLAPHSVTAIERYFIHVGQVLQDVAVCLLAP